MLEKTKTFLTDVQAELTKVTWPTRKETVATSWLVVGIIFLIGFYLGLCDMILTKLVQVVLR